MKRLACIILSLALLTSGCAGALPGKETPELPVTSGAETPSPAFSSPSQPPPPEEEPSCVEALAAGTAGEVTGGLEGEPAIRALYDHLIRSVWFSDPVGLDAWRYLPPYREEALPYLENRAFSPLQFGVGSCEDFAAAMVLLLRAAGFQAEYVAGYTLSVEQEYIDHAWAVVSLEGGWYHLDPQLEQNVTRRNRLTYRYYLRSDEDYAADHKWGENLIAHWPDMPEGEKDAIRERYTPPLCPASYPQPEPLSVSLPLPPDRAGIDAAIEGIRLSGGLGQLPPMRLNVEPPVLVAARHVTPPLLPEAKAAASGYGRGFLSGAAAALYDRLPSFLDSMEDGALLPLEGGLPDEEAEAVIRTFLTENPTYYWARPELIREPGSRVIRLGMAFPAGEIAKRQSAIDARAEEILAPLQGKNDFETALAIHDALAAVSYDSDGQGADSRSLYGVLAGGKAICNGYAAGFHYLAGLAGLESAVLEGTSTRGVPHAWNAVRLDGSWHYVDCTWDRPLAPEDGVYHDFFLMSAEEMARERVWRAEQYPEPPNPTEGFSGYYERMGYAVSGLPGEDAVQALADIFYRQLTAGDLPSQPETVFLELKVSGSEEEYQAWKAFYVKELFAVQRGIQALAEEKDGGFRVEDPQSAKCNFNDTTRVLTLYPVIRAYHFAN